jgi:site-specific recombinase XerD
MVIRIQQAKGHQDRFVMLSPKLLALLRHYWKAYRPPQWLFPGRLPTQPIHPASVYEICRQAGAAAHVSVRLHPHLLRHAFATHLLEAGVDAHRVDRLRQTAACGPSARSPLPRPLHPSRGDHQSPVARL